MGQLLWRSLHKSWPSGDVGKRCVERGHVPVGANKHRHKKNTRPTRILWRFCGDFAVSRPPSSVRRNYVRVPFHFTKSASSEQEGSQTHPPPAISEVRHRAFSDRQASSSRCLSRLFVYQGVITFIRPQSVSRFPYRGRPSPAAAAAARTRPPCSRSPAAACGPRRGAGRRGCPAPA